MDSTALRSTLLACLGLVTSLGCVIPETEPSPVTDDQRALGLQAEAPAVSDAVLERASAAGHERRRQRIDGRSPWAVTGPRPGALSGKRIAISPGHGNIYRDGAWDFQRGVTHSLREDLHTNEWAIDFLIEMLERAGAEVVNLRERSYQLEARLVDNDDGAGLYSEVGPWETSSAPGYEGSTYRYAYCDGLGAAEARWTVEVPADGEYPVYVYFLASDNRTDAAWYRVEHAGGVTERSLTQRRLLIESYAGGEEPPGASPLEMNDLWHYLGTFPFRAGEPGQVALTNQCDDSEDVVIADAIWVGGGPGTVDLGGGPSGRPRWEESALVFLEWAGAPDWVLTNDVTTRPLYSIYQGVDAFFSLHTNCCDSSGTSTWTWYPRHVGARVELAFRVRPGGAPAGHVLVGRCDPRRGDPHDQDTLAGGLARRRPLGGQLR